MDSELEDTPIKINDNIESDMSTILQNDVDTNVPRLY